MGSNCQCGQRAIWVTLALGPAPCWTSSPFTLRTDTEAKLCVSPTYHPQPQPNGAPNLSPHPLPHAPTIPRFPSQLPLSSPSKSSTQLQRKRNSSKEKGEQGLPEPHPSAVALPPPPTSSPQAHLHLPLLPTSSHSQHHPPSYQAPRMPMTLTLDPQITLTPYTSCNLPIPLPSG